MRHYQSFPEALNEIQRDLAEMGCKVHTKSVQNKNIEASAEHETLEIQNYTYLITSPDRSLIPLKNPTWCNDEFLERIGGEALNPGKAWELRADLWEPLKSVYRPGMFDYTYSERMEQPLLAVVSALERDINTRRAFLPIFDRQLDDQDCFCERIPCSLGYWFYYRQNKLNMTYLQRSADWSEHFNNDLWLANSLQVEVARRLKVESGTFSHWIGSLHVFKKDVAGTF